jgi:LPXTG-site transpeptidase (sortase) family protein
VTRAVATQPRVIPAIKGTPVRIVIPSLGIDLPVAVGSYNPNDASWTLDNTKAYYADNSLPANDSNGKTIIYGHAQAPVFAALIYLPPEAKAEVYTDSGHVFHYVYTTMKEVDPTDTTIFGADGPPTLVLQTCSGPWDAYRALFSFKLEAVQKI